MTDNQLPDPHPDDPRGGTRLDDWRATPGQLAALAGLTASYLDGNQDVSPRELSAVCGGNPVAGQLVLACWQLLDETQTGDRDVLTARLRATALLYAERDADGWSNRLDGAPQIDWRTR